MKQHDDIGKTWMRRFQVETGTLPLRAKSVALWLLLSMAACSVEVKLGSRDDAGTAGGEEGTAVVDERPDAAGQQDDGGAGPNSWCGNGVLESNEQCDDGNVRGGDGCSGACLWESGWDCPTPNQPCAASAGKCGDGTLDPGEECDLGAANGTPTSPCQSGCRISVCGNGRVESSESCDDGNHDSGDGCTSTCAIEPGWTCTAGMPCHATSPTCGDGIVQAELGEECDMGTANGTPNSSCQTDCRISVCGNGRVESGESCDDNNRNSGDGCTSTCAIEPGWTCTAGLPCRAISPVCGDGIVQIEFGEQCDEGTANGSEDCSLSCQLTLALCGNGLLESGEQCDDGNAISADGCSASCQLEPGWSCPGTGRPCQ